MSERVNDRYFYQEAYEMIFQWLTLEEKVQFNLELLDDEKIIKDPDYVSLLLRLIRFVQVKYINVKKYSNGILEHLSHISQKSGGKKINDVVFSNEDEKYSLFEINSSLDQEKTSNAFQTFLKETKLQSRFEQYLRTLESKEEMTNGSEY